MSNPIAKWSRRHRNRMNFWLHMLGIPACFIAGPLMLILGRPLLAVGLFVGGYVLQFAGHLVEGNRSGERILLQRLLGRREPPP